MHPDLLPLFMPSERGFFICSSPTLAFEIEFSRLSYVSAERSDCRHKYREELNKWHSHKLLYLLQKMPLSRMA